MKVAFRTLLLRLITKILAPHKTQIFIDLSITASYFLRVY